MAFVRAKTVGWAFGEILTSAQMNQIDTDHVNAIDGVGGGSYTLTAPLIIDGDTVEIETADIDVLTVGTVATFSGPIQVGTDLQVLNDAQIQGDIQVLGDADLQGDVLVTGSQIISNNLTIGGLLSGRVLFNGALVPNTDSSISITTNRFLNAASPICISTRLTTLTGSTTDGDWFVFQNSSGFTQNITGAVTASILNNTGRLYLKIGGAWSTMMNWTI